jgi:acetolactate synthase-1/2/3 large subunit
MCKGFGVTCERARQRVRRTSEQLIKRMLDSEETYVLDIMTPYTEHVLPMIPSGMTHKDIITE